MNAILDLMNEHTDVEWMVQQYLPAGRILMIQAWTGKDYIFFHCHGVSYMRLPLRFFHARFEFRDARNNSGSTQLSHDKETGSGMTIHSEGMTYCVACKSISNSRQPSISPITATHKYKFINGGNVARLLLDIEDMNGARMELAYLTISHGAIEIRIIKPPFPEKIIAFVAAKFVEIVPSGADICLEVASVADLNVVRKRCSTLRVTKPLLPEDVLAIHSEEQTYYVWAEKCHLYQLNIRS